MSDRWRLAMERLQRAGCHVELAEALADRLEQLRTKRQSAEVEVHLLVRDWVLRDVRLDLDLRVPVCESPLTP